MYNFFKDIAKFAILPLLVFSFVEIILPPTAFTFRAWEAISSKSGLLLGPFYPNQNIQTREVGDLAPHTKYAVIKEVAWKTDILGYRNDVFAADSDIVLIGDSNTAGSSLSQDEILARRLEQHTRLTSYSLAPADFETYVSFRNEGLIQGRQWVVLSVMERSLLALPPYDASAKRKYSKLRLNPFIQFAIVQFDKLSKANSLQYAKSHIRGTTRLGLQSTIVDSVFFLQGANAVIEPSEENIRQVIDQVKNYKSFCDSIGCRFIFMAIPNKETVCWNLAGLEEQPQFISEVNREMAKNEIITVEILELFNRMYGDGTIPFHLDDSHWNASAVDSVAKEIAFQIERDKGI